jgi:hypothetical protein
VVCRLANGLPGGDREFKYPHRLETGVTGHSLGVQHRLHLTAYVGGTEMPSARTSGRQQEKEGDNDTEAYQTDHSNAGVDNQKEDCSTSTHTQI